MTELNAFFESFGFRNVMTYIQSGNIIFDAEEEPSVSFLEVRLQERFNTKNVAVLLKTPEDMAAVIRQNPFSGRADFNTKKLYVQYLEAVPEQKRLEALTRISFEDEFFSISGQVIYVYYETTRGNAKLSNAFFEKQLGVRATARNWNTTCKLLSLAGGD